MLQPVGNAMPQLNGEAPAPSNEPVKCYNFSQRQAAEALTSLALDPVADVRHEVALFQRGLHPLTRDPVAFSSPTRLLHKIVKSHNSFESFLFQVGASVAVPSVVSAGAR